MCVHWVRRRPAGGPWRRGLAVNGLGVALTGSILVALAAIKFFEGGWVTLVATAAVVGAAVLVRWHYRQAAAQIGRLDLAAAEAAAASAVVLCNGYNGLGVRTFAQVFRTFPATFDRCVFVHAGVVDAGAFKGADEIDRLRAATADQAGRYVALARRCGLAATAATAIGPDLEAAVDGCVTAALRDDPTAVVFAGQLTFRVETVWTRWLHNALVFALQRTYCRRGVPFVIVPIGLD